MTAEELAAWAADFVSGVGVWLTTPAVLPYYAIIALAGVMTLAALRASADMRWIGDLDLSEYGGMAINNLAVISRADTAQRYLDNIEKYEADMWQAAMARARRLILVGIVLPSLVTLLALGNFSWLFPGELPLVDASKMPFAPNINQALIFISTQEASFLAEFLSIFGLDPFPFDYNHKNWVFGLLVYSLKLFVSGYLLALIVFRWRMRNFGEANADAKNTLRGKIAAGSAGGQDNVVVLERSSPEQQQKQAA